ncbi:hypothetical protein [Salinicoccus halitifaciens]|uniref:Site-specific DNA-methyltransferase (adenine-specific) n=1 Tax=Salinicoccus halitifaciens TaxID=1073415 RepID=A0ABV2ECU4_9STAP|nr:hypothetical protein [Salinicoccus halitifaciens]MCD2137369.1 hypothetical protein [Salinicoccus halitifaciens]
MAKITKKDNAEFKRSLKNAKNEEDIQAAYKRIFHKRFVSGDPKAIINNQFGSDGYLHTHGLVLTLRMLMEFKSGTSLTDVSTRARIIAQVLYYLKRFEIHGDELPNVIFSGDEEEMFVVYAPVLYHYLKEDYNWAIAPSNAGFVNTDLLRKLIEDPNLSSFIFDIRTPNFDINDVLNAIDSLVINDGVVYKIRVNEANLRVVFEEFVRMLFAEDRKVKVGLDPKKQPHLLVQIFIQSILGNPDIYPVPRKKNTLKLPDGNEVKLDTTAYSSFFTRYERKYTIEEKDTIKAIADQLIEETERRYSGDFWTPTVWADKAHTLIEQQLGKNWRNEYVVWDPACGTKNLTRDYQFKELYSSTLFQEELNMADAYNRDSISFQYDFLNDDIDIKPDLNLFDLKMPKELFQALQNDKPIVFFANPPYATANDAGAKGTSKQGTAKTRINEIMKEDKLGSASQQLYAQFFYRILKLKKDFKLSNVHIAFFSKPTFLNGGSYWEKFNQRLFEQFKFKDGMLLKSGEFSDVTDIWAVTFSIYSARSMSVEDFEREFKMSVEHLTPEGIKKIGNKTIRMVGQEDFLSEWLREPTKGRRDYKAAPYPQFSSIFNVNESKAHRGKLLSDAFGYFVNVANNVYNSQRDVVIYSGSAYKANGVSITKDNFERVAVTFASRKSVTHNWLNDNDNFKTPHEVEMRTPAWSDFVNDCIIYSLFNITASYQSSQAEVLYNGDFYEIKNEMFYMSKDRIKKLAQDRYLNEIEEQLRFQHEERYVYSLINDRKLSPEAQRVYDEAVKLTEKAFDYRDIVNLEHPEWNVKRWDAGFYQTYKIINKYKIIGWNEFRELFKELERKIERKVYKFGMLIE